MLANRSSIILDPGYYDLSPRVSISKLVSVSSIILDTDSISNPANLSSIMLDTDSIVHVANVSSTIKILATLI